MVHNLSTEAASDMEGLDHTADDQIHDEKPGSQVALDAQISSMLHHTLVGGIQCAFSTQVHPLAMDLGEVGRLETIYYLIRPAGLVCACMR